MSQALKLLFWGTPAAAVPFLEACAGRCRVLAAVTAPDRPAGRGLKLASPPVKEAALRLGISVLQPESPLAAASGLRSLGADLAVVVAYGKILKPEVLAATRLGFMNVHFSLLPKYRGAAPVARALMNGEPSSGVTLFWLEEGMDTGPIQARRETGVGPEEDARTLLARLSVLGAELLLSSLRDVAEGRVRREPQSGEPSYAPKLRPEEGRLDFGGSAPELHNRVRGLAAGPAAFWLDGRGRRVAALKSSLGEASAAGPAGTVVRVERERGLLVQCGLGRLWLHEVRPEGKKQINAADFAHGMRLKPGDGIARSGL